MTSLVSWCPVTFLSRWLPRCVLGGRYLPLTWVPFLRIFLFPSHPHVLGRVSSWLWLWPFMLKVCESCKIKSPTVWLQAPLVTLQSTDHLLVHSTLDKWHLLRFLVPSLYHCVFMALQTLSLSPYFTFSRGLVLLGFQDLVWVLTSL